MKINSISLPFKLYDSIYSISYILSILLIKVTNLNYYIKSDLSKEIRLNNIFFFIGA